MAAERKIMSQNVGGNNAVAITTIIEAESNVANQWQSPAGANTSCSIARHLCALMRRRNVVVVTSYSVDIFARQGERKPKSAKSNEYCESVLLLKARSDAPRRRRVRMSILNVARRVLPCAQPSALLKSAWQCAVQPAVLRVAKRRRAEKLAAARIIKPASAAHQHHAFPASLERALAPACRLTNICRGGGWQWRRALKAWPASIARSS